MEIEIENANIAAEMDHRTRTTFFKEADELETALLARFGIDTHGLLLRKHFRFDESTLDYGETISALGLGLLELDPKGIHQERGYREQVSYRPRIVGSKEWPVYISDDKKLGKQ